MNTYIGIHCGLDGYGYVEFANANDRNEAYEKMERNDTHLTLLTFEEYVTIHNKVEQAFANEDVSEDFDKRIG